jgi:hypothetical protein
MLGLQAVQKSNVVCVDTNPPSAPFSFRSVLIETVLKLSRQKGRFQTISLRRGVHVNHRNNRYRMRT